MVRRILIGVALTLTSCAAIPIALGPASAPAGASPATAVQQCKNGGWQTLTDASGQPFRNQGQCSSYFIHNPAGLADLAGSFSGTTSFSGGTGGCAAIEQVFDATYPGTSAVGSVTLHLDGCVLLNSIPLTLPLTYAGTFAIATSAGTLTGNAAGPINNLPANQSLPVDFELTLTVLSGSGAFAGTTGLIHLSVLWPPPYGTQVSGSVSVP